MTDKHMEQRIALSMRVRTRQNGKRVQYSIDDPSGAFRYEGHTRPDTMPLAELEYQQEVAFIVSDTLEISEPTIAMVHDEPTPDNWQLWQFKCSALTCPTCNTFAFGPDESPMHLSDAEIEE
jgi:hypothetical protein